MTRHRFAVLPAVAAVAALYALPVASAASRPNPAPVAGSQPASVSRAKKTVEVRSSRLGRILVDSRGRTLYIFEKDSRGKSACNGECARFWPAVRVSGRPTAGSGISVAKLGTIRRSDGTRQVTYNGHPLYSFVQDSRPGETHGQGVTAFGGTWFVLSPTGRPISRG